MKSQQIILSGIVLFIAIQIPLVTAYAQAASSSVARMPSPTLSSDSAKTSDYQLPYPGLLPDNPLYFLKIIRDNLTSVFISKPLDKASFDLLQSDKDVEASYLLIIREQGKGDLALKTYAQSQDYFEDAIKQTLNARKQGYSIQDTSKKLQAANKKHVQMLQSIGGETRQENSQIYKNEHHRAEALTQMVKAL